MWIDFGTVKAINPAKALVNYIIEDRGRNDRGFEHTYFHNLLHTDTTEEISQEFMWNADHLKRKKGIIYRHTIISFHPNDAPNITPEKMLDIGKKFLELSGSSNCLALLHPHCSPDTQPHLHMLISVNEARGRDRKATRLGGRDFSKLTRQMEEYQLTTYPEIQFSKVYTLDRSQKKKRNRESKQEKHFKRRTGKKTLRQDVRETVLRYMEKADNREHFDQLIENSGFLMPYRDGQGQVVGVIPRHSKRKFSFTGALAITSAHINDLSLDKTVREIKQRIREVSELQQSELPKLDKKRGRGDFK